MRSTLPEEQGYKYGTASGFMEKITGLSAGANRLADYMTRPEAGRLAIASKTISMKARSERNAIIGR